MVRALRLAMDSDSHGLLDGHAKGMQLQFNEVIGMINAELGTNIKQKYVFSSLEYI